MFNIRIQIAAYALLSRTELQSAEAKPAHDSADRTRVAGPACREIAGAPCMLCIMVVHTPQTERANFVKRNAKRTVSRLYLGMGGYLFELSPGLWRNIPYHDELPFEKLRTRPRVTVCGIDRTAETVTLIVQPMPECGYVINILSNDDPEKVAKAQRAKLMKNSPSSRLIYSASFG